MFSPRDDRIVTTSMDRTTKFYDRTSCKTTVTLKYVKHGLHNILMSRFSTSKILRLTKDIYWLISVKCLRLYYVYAAQFDIWKLFVWFSERLAIPISQNHAKWPVIPQQTHYLFTSFHKLKVNPKWKVTDLYVTDLVMNEHLLSKSRVETIRHTIHQQLNLHQLI